MAEFYGINTEGASVEEVRQCCCLYMYMLLCLYLQEVLERDLEKFLESARLSKYMQAFPPKTSGITVWSKSLQVPKLSQQAALDWSWPKLIGVYDVKTASRSYTRSM